MTLGKRYDEVMEHIELTPEMRQRILRNIQAMDIPQAAPKKIIRFPGVKRMAALAACLAVILVGALVLPRLSDPAGPRRPPYVLGPQDIAEYETLAELSRAVGFPIEEPAALPFEPQKVEYTSVAGIAQVSYQSGENDMTYRKGLGDGDISGDYSTYPNTITAEMDGRTVTLKGDGQVYALATWTEGDYTYSVSLSQGISKSEWQDVLKKDGQ